MDFKKTEQRFKKIKAKLISGKISEAKFKTQLEKLILQDDHGSWWTIGYETEHWYRHDGNDWIQTNPPANQAEQETDTQKFHWRLGKKEIIWSLAGMGIYFILAFPLKSSDSMFRYWFPSHTVPIFFGLIFGPIVGAIVGAGQYLLSIITSTTSLYLGLQSVSQYFFSYFSNINLIAFATEGAVMGLIKGIPRKGRPSLKPILHLELFIILANLIRILMSQNLSTFVITPVTSNYIMNMIGYPLFGELIVVPICYMVYLFFSNNKKLPDSEKQTTN